ncbi:MAG: HAMP domain-containing histidine kinase [Halobacteriovoraceae bacterium]|nr:HAMP domain-containing histidine kinase [Halobacteriovoraceae bacterium]
MYDVPIWGVDDVLGVLCLEYLKQKKSWSEREKQFVHSIGVITAMIFDKHSVLTQLKKIENFNDELKAVIEERTKKLENAQKKLIQQEKMVTLATLTAGIAHELRNPLNLVIGSGQVIQELLNEINIEDKELKDGLNEASQIVIDSGKRANDVIDNMLGHAKEDSGKKESAQVILNVSMDLAYHTMRAKNPIDVTIHKDISGAEDFYVSESLFQRVILGLLENSFYSLNKKLKKDMNFIPKLNVSSRQKGDQLVVQIYDNGIGMGQVELRKIFDPFFTTKGVGEGTGLGMYLASDTINSIGGTIHVDAEEGKWCEVTIELPKQEKT